MIRLLNKIFFICKTEELATRDLIFIFKTKVSTIRNPTFITKKLAMRNFRLNAM